MPGCTEEKEPIVGCGVEVLAGYDEAARNAQQNQQRAEPEQGTHAAMKVRSREWLGLVGPQELAQATEEDHRLVSPSRV